MPGTPFPSLANLKAWLPPLPWEAKENPKEVAKDKIEASCLPCSRNHLISIKAALTEAVRMAKSRPISDPEIQERISKAEEELNAWERFDLSPAKVAALASEERKIVTEISSKARSQVRHMLDSTGVIWGAGTLEDLQNIAASADEIEREFRTRITPLVLNKIKQRKLTS